MQIADPLTAANAGAAPSPLGGRAPRGPGCHATLTVGLGADLCPTLVESPPLIPRFAATLEEWGVGQVTVGDRVLTEADLTHPNGGEKLPPPDHPLYEPLIMLAAAASCTSRIRLATGILIAPLRNAPLLAKTAATLDALSDGRLDLGLSAGWYRGEFAALGISFDDRFGRLDETVDVCRTLWREAPASFSGRWTSFVDVYCSPHPVAPDGLPVWIAGYPGRIQARRVAARGDGWLFNSAATPDDIARSMVYLRDACAAIGRDPLTIPIRAMLPSAPRLGIDGVALDEQLSVLRPLATRFIAAGVTHLLVSIGSYANDLDRAHQVVSALLDHFAATPLMTEIDEEARP